eukprot:TRINITY_DN3574_c0_g1_i1.p1 TRINITY_DN3574_c0_g1~~TRINITY_DN3574_c0_g1_i1.p1  ORF type:complete len:498 (+),score=79.51 TRINITY_DN3574_c0_g1_i1:172-1665(+)
MIDSILPRLSTVTVLLLVIMFTAILYLEHANQRSTERGDILQRELTTASEVINKMRQQLHATKEALVLSETDLILEKGTVEEYKNEIAELNELQEEERSESCSLGGGDSDSETKCNIDDRWKPSNAQEQLQYNLFARYAELHGKIMDNDPSVEQKYVLFRQETSGLGNTITAFISSFMLALLTDRAIILESHSILSLYDPPPYLKLRESQIKGSYGSKTTFTQVGGFAEMGGGGPKSQWFEWISCADLKETLAEHQTIEVVSNQYYAPLLINNPHYIEFFMKTFGKDVYGPFYRFILNNVKPHLVSKVNAFKEKYYKDNFIVGMHMRREYLNPKRASMFWPCADMLSPTIDNEDGIILNGRLIKKVYWYVATDSSFASEAKRKYGDKIITYADFQSESGDVLRAMDYFLVGDADEIIATSGSTFSDIMFARTGKVPHQVTEVNTCYKNVHNQPCYFFWKGVLDTSCYPNGYDDLFRNPMMINQRNCYTNFQHGADHM